METEHQRFVKGVATILKKTLIKEKGSEVKKVGKMSPVNSDINYTRKCLCKCDSLGKSVKHNLDLLNHGRTCVTKKHHECNKPGKPCHRSSTIAVAPFKCAQCGKGFIQELDRSSKNKSCS